MDDFCVRKFEHYLADLFVVVEVGLTVSSLEGSSSAALPASALIHEGWIYVAKFLAC